MTAFRPGDQVTWWKRITRSIDYPYRAQVVAVGPRRIAISVEDPSDADIRFLRHVSAEHLQPVAGYYSKAAGQGPAILEPAARWGRFTIYLEIGEDLRPVREVLVFENGNLLSYDRSHWIDDFGMLGDARINRSRTQGRWGQSEEIEPAELERVWSAARASPMWLRQAATAQMAGWVPCRFG
jgi:hypothetical protein